MLRCLPTFSGCGILSTVHACAPASEGCSAEPVLFVEVVDAEVEEVVESTRSIACHVSVTIIGTMVTYQYVFVCVTFLVDACVHCCLILRAEYTKPEKSRICI